jgi:hypothetical protein
MPGQPTDAEVRPADELSRIREENLRLRDLLIAKDAELGSLRGQVAALEAGTGRLLSLVGRIRSMVPGPLLRILAQVRGRAPQG